ncbi:MAG: DUF480 domain-containing protein [Planctomycetota bacterium]
MDETTGDNQPKWQILDRVERRVVGVLVEKAKTTPDNYPLTLNSLLNGANQKSNRFPQMQLDEEHVFDALERLRKYGAVAEVQGDGRAAKFRHLAYDWLGVDKHELAVMAELLLRGAQTLGELRGRAARMEKIPGISDLRPIVDSLYAKQLIIYLTPPGRGCIVTHALYQEQELEKLRAEHGNQEIDVPVSTPVASSTPIAPAAPSNDEVADLRAEVVELRDRVGRLEDEIEQLKSSLGV